MGGIALDDVSRAELITAMTQVGCMGRAPCELVPTVPPTSALPPSPSSAPSPDPPSSPWVGSQRLLRPLRRRALRWTFDARRLQRAAEPEDLHVTIRFGSIDSDGAEAKPTDKAALEAEVASLLPQETYPDASLTLLVESGAVHVELTLAGRGTPDAVLQAQVQNSSLVHVALNEALGRAVEVAVAVSSYVAPPAAPPSPLPPPPPPPPPPLLYVWPGCADSSATNYAPGDQVNSIVPDRRTVLPKAKPYTSATSIHSTYPHHQVVHNPSLCRYVDGTSIGCLSPRAVNYDASAALHHAGACVYDVAGCMDSTAANFASDATSASACSYEAVHSYGCTLPSASNYDSLATALADGTCVIAVTGCMDSTALTYAADATVHAMELCVD